MGFPGRLNEKKRVSVGFWLTVIVVIGMIGWAAYGVMKTLRTPLTQQQKQEIYVVKPAPGFIEKKVDRLGDDLGQIRKGEITKRTPDRAYGGRITVYEPPESDKKQNAPADYYSAGKCSPKKQ